jgi:transposase-like protein
MSYKRYTKDFKQKVLREVGAGTGVAVVARRYAVSRQLVYEWLEKQRDGALSDSVAVRQSQLEREVADLERKVGQLTMENEFLKETLERLEQRYPRLGEDGARPRSPKSSKR